MVNHYIDNLKYNLFDLEPEEELSKKLNELRKSQKIELDDM